MRKHSNGKKWTVEVEAWGATRARAVERERMQWRRAWTRAEVREEVWAQPWDLAKVQVQVQAHVVAQALAQALAQAEMEAEASDRASKWSFLVKLFDKGPSSLWALELAEVYKAMRAWMQVLGPGKLQAWMRVWAVEAPAGSARREDIYFRHGDFDHYIDRSGKLHYLSSWPRRRQDYWWLIPIITPITRLPPELLHQIFLIVIDNANESPLVLMRVCKNWYNIVTSIWASLKLGTATPKDVITKKLERSRWLLDVLVDTEIDSGHSAPSEGAYQAIFAAIQATSRWRTLVVETFPSQADLPEDVVNCGLQQSSDLVMSRLRTLTIKCPCEMSALLERLLRILGNTTSGELMTVTINSAIVISFLVPIYSSIFRSVTMLSLDDVDLPFVHTLRHLTLRSTSIQWMSGRTFHLLESCTIIFPLGRHILHTFRTTLPNCKDMSFEAYPLDILTGISAHKLRYLSVKCPSAYTPRGNRQLVLFSSQALQEGRLAPRILHIGIEATNEAWTKAFTFMSNLEGLVIDNAQPSSLGVMALLSLVILLVDANNMGTTGTPGSRNTPACPLLKRFGLRYRRWLRSSEHFDLIPVFESIIDSRQQSGFPLQSFCIWGSSDQKGPLELIDGSQISPKPMSVQSKDGAYESW